MMPELDDKDWKIIECLKENSRQSSYLISKKTAIPLTTVHNRIKKLEREGVIKNYTVVLDDKLLGKQLTAYTFIKYNIAVWGKETTKDHLRKQLLELPNVEEIKYIIGRFDILLKVKLESMDELNSTLLLKLRKIPGIGQTETFFVLEDIK